MVGKYTGIAACVTWVALSASTAVPRDQTGLETVRLRGEVLSEGGGPLPNVRIRTDAIRGPGGAQFVGQRLFDVRTGRNGEWALLGATRGLWVLELTASEHLPHVVVLPIYMMRRPEPRPWDSSLAVLPEGRVTGSGPDDAGRRVVEAAERLLAGDKTAAREALVKLAELSMDAAALCAMGDLALLIREPTIARRYFDLAAAAAPQWYRPQLGIGSASMMMFDFDRAMNGYAAARAAVSNKRVEQMLSGVVAELQQIRRIGGG